MNFEFFSLANDFSDDEEISEVFDDESFNTAEANTTPTNLDDSNVTEIVSKQTFFFFVKLILQLLKFFIVFPYFRYLTTMKLLTVWN